MVHAGLTALVARVSREVEHVPDVRGPEVGALVKELEHVLVVDALILLRVVLAAGLGGVEVGHGLAAILAHADGAVPVKQAPDAKPGLVEPEAGHVPAQVEVPGHDVGDVGALVVPEAHRVAGERRGARGVHLVDEVVEHAVVVQHVSVVLGGDGDLVGEAPHADARVVVVLDDEFPHLRDGVPATVRHVLGDVGNLGPDHHAGLVAQVIEDLAVLVVREADGVGTDLLDELHVLAVHLGREGIADALAVLVARDAAQRVAAPVQEEAPVGVDVEAANAKAAAHGIRGHAGNLKREGRGVEVGILDAIPAMDVFDDERDVGHAVGHGSARGGHLGSPGVGETDAHDGALRGRALDPTLDANLGRGGGVVDLGRHGKAGAAKVVEGEVGAARHEELDVAVDATVEGEVGLLRVDAVVLRVVHAHNELVGLAHGPERVGDVDTEGGVAAVVVREGSAVELHVCRGVDAIELKVDNLICLVRRRGERAGIGAGAAPVVIAAVLAVDGVPSVRNVDLDGGAVWPREAPALVQALIGAHGYPFSRHACRRASRAVRVPCMPTRRGLGMPTDVSVYEAFKGFLRAGCVHPANGRFWPVREPDGHTLPTNGTGMPVSAGNQCIDASMSGGLDTNPHRTAHRPIARLSTEASAKIDVLA